MINDLWETTLDAMAAEGYLSSGLRSAFAAVDRGGFIPESIWLIENGKLRPINKTTDPIGWHEAVYTNKAVITQTGTVGEPSSSSSEPLIMAQMLEALDVHSGHSVLELGAGTGFNAALLSLLNGGAQVTSVDIDSDVTKRARLSLDTSGYIGVQTYCTNGGAFSPEKPVDRIIATYGIDAIAPAWVQSLKPGGKIVAPWRANDLNETIICFTADDNGNLAGRVVTGCGFMPDRTSTSYGNQRTWLPSEDGNESTTIWEPTFFERTDIGLWLTYRMPEIVVYLSENGYILHDAATESTAQVEHNPCDDGEWPVMQTGKRRLWDEIEASLDAWFDQGSPLIDAWSVRLDSDGELKLFLN